MTELNQLTRMFKQNKISRRQFITQLSALGISAAMIPSVLTSKASAATPKRGGTFRQAMTGGATQDTFDPGLLTSNHNINCSNQVSNCLIEIDHNFQPIPELAESWDASPDAKKWTFKLRKGVEFHNGKTMTAEDVVFSLNHHRGEESKSAAKPFLKPVTDIRADGKYEVIIELEDGNADFPFIMGDYHLRIYPDGTKGDDWQKGIGTGGYILESWEPGVKMVSRRNPNYFKSDRAFFDSVETLHIPDVNARSNALKTGRIDVMDRVDLKTVHLFKRMPGVEVTAITGTMHYSMPMLVDVKPYDNPDVRMALKLIIDREAMMKTILKGYGELGNDHPISSVNRYHASHLTQRTFDPDKAKSLIKKAGAQDYVFNLSASEAAFGGAVDAAVLYQETAKQAGIKINVIREPSDGYWSNVWTKKEFCMCYWSGRPTEDMMFSVAYAAGAPWNDTHWANKHFNELLVQARAELDEKKRQQMYWEMQEICRDDGGTIIPLYNQIVEANSGKLGHGDVSAHMELDGHKNAERWWFA